MTAKAMPPWKRQMVKWSIVGIVLSLLVIVMLGDEPDDGQPQTIASVSKQISSVTRDNEYLNVDVALETPWDAASSVSQASILVLDVIKRIQAGAPDARGPGIMAVQFTFSVPTRTPLGEEGRADLINMRIDSEVLMNAKPERMTNFDIVEVSNVEIPSRFGRDAARDYCAENAKFSPRFCAKLAMGLL